MGENPTSNDLDRVATTTADVTAGGTTQTDIDIPQGDAVLLAWGHDTQSTDNSKVTVRLVQDNDKNRQTVEVTEQGGNNAATVTITVFSPR